MVTVTALYRISEARTRYLSVFADAGASLSETISLAEARANENEVLESITVRPTTLLDD